MNKYQEDIKYALYHYYNGNEDKVNEALIATGINPPTINIGFIELFQRGVIDIHLGTQSEWNECMEILERETTLTWLSGRKPTEVNHWESFQEDTILICDDGVISYDYYRKPRQRIEFKKIIGEE